jgi:hypothetical protein
MNEHHSPDAGSEYLYFSDNSEIAGTTIDGQSDRIFSSGIIPNEIAESVAESPAARYDLFIYEYTVTVDRNRAF